jgi:4-amino-4-deoxy-L-arabinose transferase-like glycosyltransferase
MVSFANHRGMAWFVWTVCLTLVFGRIAAYNLGNYRPVTNDEVELISVAYKLATQGVLGSDLFAGFFGADQHFFFVLPLQHVLEAATFRVFGPGVAQARWVSLVAGVSIVWLVGWLAYRWYGLATAIVCGLLLVAWPSDLTAAANGLPLFGVARTARYDVLAVAFAWLTIALLDLTLRRPRRVTGFVLGISCGLAALTTFLGAFVLPVVVLNRFRTRGQQPLYWVLAGTGLVLLPWAIQLVRYPADLAGQLAVFGARGDFLRPSFYLTNVLSEPSRYQGLQLDSSSSVVGFWLLAVGIWPAVAYIGWRCWRWQAACDRILLSSLLTFAGLLLVLDQTKTPLYAIILFPSLCMALAVLLTTAVRTAWRHGWALRLASVTLTLGLVFGIGSDAVRDYQLSLAQSAAAGRYLDVGAEVEGSLEPGARVLGPERWWWALHDHPYVSLRNLWFQWSASAANGRTPEFVDLVTEVRADSVIVNDNVRGDLLDFPGTLQQQFWTFIDTCTQRVADLNDPTYLEIEVYAIVQPSPRPEVCGTRT